jgi:hypothetical protein
MQATRGERPISARERRGEEKQQMQLLHEAPNFGVSTRAMHKQRIVGAHLSTRSATWRLEVITHIAIRRVRKDRVCPS